MACLLTFTAYYAPIFAEFPQKAISGFITSLWQTDPFKAKWSIIAKAYSEIRDSEGREQAPLNVFLPLAAAALYMVAPAEYLIRMGWEIKVENGESQLIRHFVPELLTFDENTLSTNLSVPDLIKCCRSCGYGSPTPSPLAHPLFDQGPIMVMAAHTQINTPNSQPFHTVESITPQSDNAGLEHDLLNALGNNEKDMNFQPDLEFKQTTAKNGDNVYNEKVTLQGNNFIHFAKMDSEATVKSTAQNQKTCEQILRESGDTFPFYKQFDPHGQHVNDLLYDPFDPTNPMFGNYASGDTSDPNDWFTNFYV